jgi:hypothetical protein
MLNLIGVALANPIAVSHPVHIASERLDTVVDTDFALISGVFRFRSEATNGGFASSSPISMDIPIWIPRDARTSPEGMQAFWKSFKIGQSYLAAELPVEAWNDCIGFKVLVGNKPIAISSVTLIDSKSRAARKSQPLMLPEGFCCVMVSVSFPAAVIGGDTTVTLRYKQALRQSRDGAEFYYLPLFWNLPKDRDTSDRRVYALNVRPGRGIRLSLGGFAIPQEHSAQLPLGHQEAIRIKAKQG